jgi:outer membrane biosynthesis protein TonB
MNRALGLAAVSVAFHAVILFSVDHAVTLNQETLSKEAKKILNKNSEGVSFEFVEAPAKIYPQKPENTKKISDRDALNQDLTPNKSKSTGGPATAARGPSDQLAQKRVSPSQIVEPRPKVDPKPKQVKEITPKPPLSEMSEESKMAEVKKDIQEQKPKAPVEPQAPVQGLTGQDKITTQETGKVKSQGAALLGTTSFEATGSGMGEYMKNLKEKIWLAWFPHLAFHFPQDFGGADAVVSMTLNAQGEVKILKIVDSQGSEIFAAYCLDAIQRASGFGSLPQELLAITGKDELEIKFGFHYR